MRLSINKHRQVIKAEISMLNMDLTLNLTLTLKSNLAEFRGVKNIYAN